MRVLLVADVVGGVRTFVAELARGLGAHGVELHLALLGADAIDLGPACSCEVRNLRLEWMDDAWDDVEATAEWVQELCARHRPDVIHMNTFAPVHGADLPVLLTVHSCVLTWWRAVHGRDAPASWDRYRALARSALDRAALLTVPSRGLLDELRAVHGTLPDARVIANGRSVAGRGRGGGGAGGGRRERLVVSAGRLWDEAKNAALVARAAGLVRGRVALAGPGGERAPAAVERLGLLGEDELLGWMRRASVFVEPARYEPFGLAALEAALCGCALVLGDVPSLREVWGGAATYVAPDDPAALAEAVNRLLDDPTARDTAAARARAAAARYTPAAMARGYVDAYRQLARVAVAA